MKSGSQKAGFPDVAERQQIKPVRSQTGFTIVETLIVLAITGAMFLSAVVMISGRQAATQFSQGVRDVEAQLRQTMSEVSSGFYPSTQAITCTSTGPDGGPVIRGNGQLQNTQGTNKDCIFIGRIIQFAVADNNGARTDPQLYNIYTLVGIRTLLEQSGQDGLGPAKPRVIAQAAGEPAGNTPDDMFDAKRLTYGLEVVDMYHGANPDDPNTKIGAVGFTSSLGNLGGSDPSQQVNVIAVPGTRINVSKSNGVSGINGNVENGIYNPMGGIHICLKSGGTKQSALLSIGGQARQNDIAINVKDSGDCR
jgi:type II secretory pathway pseudopilin PulG